MICLWHANKAVLRHCQPAFKQVSQSTADKKGDDEWDEFFGFWHSMVASTNEAIFEERLTEFELKFAEKYLEAVGYIRTYWLDLHKESIVKAWVDKHLHFGNVATSR